MGRLALLFRWSWRDLKTHWAKVVAIALVIAIGTGGYAGLTSTAEWRRASYDASYRRLAMYDLRVDLATGAFVPAGALAEALAAVPHAGWIAGTEERLIVPTQVDASTPTETILVRGEITGFDFSDGEPEVNSYYAITGRSLSGADSGRPLVMLERNFAKFHEMADSGRIAVSGGRELEYVGQATTPEYFAVAPEGEMFGTDATFAGVFTTLETAQQLAGMPGMVNNLVLTVTDDADRDALAAELEERLSELAVGTTVSTREDNLSYASLTTDVEQDQAMFNALAFLLFAGAVGAAFNLIHRLAEQQRREIGIGMALGVQPRLLALRPLLVSAQIALLGVAFGIGVGALIGSAMGSVLRDYVPLPVWDTSFQTRVFAAVGVVGFVVPFVATVIPVWRAVRVSPIDAIKPSYLGVGTAKVRVRRRLRRKTFVVMPFRNLRRTPRRTALTVLGIAAAMTVLVAFLGIMDSVFYAIDTAEHESTASSPRRIEVALDGFYLAAGMEVAEITQSETVATVEPTLRLVASIRNGGEEIDSILELADLRTGMWSPTLTRGEVGDTPGILLTDKAASDLGVGVGDTITLRHPRREGLTSYTFVDSELPVVALHPHPVRGFSYMDITNADLMALEGVTNSMNVLPVAGATVAAVQQELFELDAVASVQSVTAVTEAVRGAFDQVLGIIQVMVVAVLLLALLIAFNTAAINLDARSREHATMFAFGVRVRTATGMAVSESFVIGVVATIIGIGGGLAMVWWMTERLLAETLPDFDLEVAIQPSTIAVVVIMGVVAVSLAPLLTVRRMRKMNLPGTLRYVE